MSSAGALLVIVGGLVALSAGAELLVRGAVSVARLARVTPAVIGLTIVAMGTSFPELAVSLVAGLEGRADVALGNIVGSNIFNASAIIGITALVTPLAVTGNTVRLEWPVMFAASFVALLLVRDTLLDRLEGGFLLVAFALFTTYAVRLGRREIADREASEYAAHVAALEIRARRRTAVLDLALIATGVVLLAVGGRLLVGGAVTLARLAGITERVIGLSIVAAGTSLPELATSVVAGLRRQPDIAVGNVIGSNIFNILAVLGVVALVRPVPASAAIVGSDFWWMLGISLLLLPILRTGHRVGRFEGAVLVGAYAVYLGVLLGSAT